jgi:ribosome biogenesis GTPase
VSLISYGWNPKIECLYSEARPGEPARVIRVDRGAAVVVDGAGERRVAVRPDLAPAVGDWVVVDGTTEPGTVRDIIPRWTAIRRRRPGAAEQQQTIAANVDRLVIVESFERGPNLRRIERAVAVAWDSGALPVVVLTKADLAEDPESVAAEVAAAMPAVPVIPVSVTEGHGAQDVLWELPEGSTAVLIGPSGVGKSTLVNALSGSDAMATGHVRAGDAKGRHTTTHRQMVALPGNRCVIDTPGLRELGLWLDAESVEASFADIEALAEQCRFRDCRHEGEPGCAVASALEAGEMDGARLGSFLRLRREAERLEQRVDPTQLRQRRAEDRRFARLVRAEVRRKRGR